MSLPERPLGDVLRLASDAVSVDPEDEYKIAGIYSFGRGLIQRPPIRGAETSYRALAKLRKGQMVMSKLNAWEGALTVVPDEFDGYFVSPEYPVFEIDTEVADPTYLGHLAHWSPVWERLTPRGSMVRRKRTSPATLLATKVPLPDLPEQRRIAARLDAAMNAISAVKEKSDHCGDLHSELLESLLSTDSGEPEVRLGDILSLERMPVEPDAEKYYVQIGIRSFGKGIFHRDKVLGNELSKLRYFEVRPGRLIVSNIMAWEGAVGVSTEAERGCVGSSRFLSYVPSEGVYLPYLGYFFQSKAGQATLRTTSTGTVLRNQTLSIDDFGNLMIPLPDTGRQREVAATLDASNQARKFAMLRDGMSIKLRESVLNAAFTGKL